MLKGHPRSDFRMAFNLFKIFNLNGAPGEIRTPGLLIRSQSLYPAELRAHMPRFLGEIAGKSLTQSIKVAAAAQRSPWPWAEHSNPRPSGANDRRSRNMRL
jgi:hypothetical protein